MFRATLANSRQDVTKILAEEIKKGGGGGRAAARQAKEDHTWFVDTDETIGMMAKWQDETTAHIQLMDGQIEAKVEKNGVIAAINLSTEGVVIKGSKITLDGTTWANDLYGLKGDFDDLKAGNLTATALKATLLQANTNFNFKGYNATWRQFTFVDDNGTPTTATFMIRSS